MHLNKMPLIARVKREFKGRCVLHGLVPQAEHYFNARFGLPGWVTPVPIAAYVPLYQRSKIGFSVHNREYTVGGFRLFDLPANGVMQISDCGRHLGAFFDVGKEIVGYRGSDDLLTKIDLFLTHPDQRVEIAVEGYRRAVRDHLFPIRMRQLGELIDIGMEAKASQDRAYRVSPSDASNSITQ